MVWIFAPGGVVGDGFLFVGIVGVEGVAVGVDEFDGVFELCERYLVL